MDIYSNDVDLWSQALSKIDLNETALPIVRGAIVENVDAYNKIQKLLNTPQLEPCHRFLYSLDVEQLSEEEVSKVNNLYKYGQDKGFIEVDEDPEADSQEDVAECDAVPASNLAQNVPQSAVPDAPVADTKYEGTAYTVAYSAMKDGEMKTGEAYSNAISTRAAKSDVISKLEKVGYTNISILCIEVGDPDLRDCPNTYVQQPVKVPPAEITSPFTSDGNFPPPAFESDEELEEADDKEGEDSKDDSEADSKDDASDDEGKEDSGEEAEEKKEDAEEPDEKLDDKSEEKAEDATDDKEEEDLKPDEKAALKDSYKKAFKAAMQKCKFETSFSELSLEDKVKFFTELSKAWGDKADPSKFMTDKEVEQLEKIVVKKN